MLAFDFKAFSKTAECHAWSHGERDVRVVRFVQRRKAYFLVDPYVSVEYLSERVYAKCNMPPVCIAPESNEVAAWFYSNYEKMEYFFADDYQCQDRHRLTMEHPLTMQCLEDWKATIVEKREHWGDEKYPWGGV